MDPVDIILDNLITISSQLIQTCTTALATTIHSRNCLETLSNIDHLLIDQTIQHKQQELNQKLHSIQTHQRELDRIQEQLLSLWPLHHHHPLKLNRITSSPQKKQPQTTQAQQQQQQQQQDNNRSPALSVKEHHYMSPTEQILSPSLPSVQYHRNSILQHRAGSKPLHEMISVPPQNLHPNSSLPLTSTTPHHHHHHHHHHHQEIKLSIKADLFPP
ncbi:hypothetical protein VP01_758g2 [Puccinia sorghi]|uniref:Uncharacterized protein n=1 Tax=Puccinia sorghi TaxID=27349 RepID=A0A0L6UE26_9BASI|nr:hypothetical protein VP01_758g2 [Puccinia sorghi]